MHSVSANTIATAGECMVKYDWQTSAARQVDEGVVCFTGPFDGHAAFPMTKGDKVVMRYITNSEIRPRSSSGFTGATAPQFFVSTNPAKGGWGQPEPSASEKLNMMGATLMYAASLLPPHLQLITRPTPAQVLLANPIPSLRTIYSPPSHPCVGVQVH